MDIYQDIKTKPIILVGQGPSVKCLQENIELFRGIDVLWGSLNRFHVAENDVLRLIDEDFDILWFSALLRYEEMFDHLKRAGKRGSLIMTKDAVVEFLPFPANIYKSDFGTGFSSLFAMLCALIKIGAQNIYLIGFDGAAQDPGEVYYGQNQMHEDHYISRMKSIARDTKMMNIFFWEYVEYAINVNSCSVSINNLLGSALTCFPHIGIDVMARRVGKGLLEPSLMTQKRNAGLPMIKVRILKDMVSPRFGNMNEGSIYELIPSSADVLIKNGLAKLVKKPAVPDPPAMPIEREVSKKKARKAVKIKKVDSYYTQDHQDLLTKIGEILRMKSEAR